MDARYLKVLWLMLTSLAAVVPADMTVDPNLISKSSGACPPCEVLFGRLEHGANGKYKQSVEASLRGEPKSGTTLTMSWARNSLYWARDYLRALYGSKSCVVENEGWDLTFNPSLADDEAPCTCDNIEKIQVHFINAPKHELPVDRYCRFAHPPGIVREVPPCSFASGSFPKTYDEMWLCMQEAACELPGEERFIAVFRDPRPVVVSTYFHMKLHDNPNLRPNENIDDFAQRMLPTLCQWITLRFLLFEGMMGETGRSISYWYHETQANPLRWHQQLYEFVGLRLPISVIEAATDAALRQDFQFRGPEQNQHPSGKPPSANRTYVDEVKSETREKMDEIVRMWLPPLLRAKLGILDPR